MRHQPHVIRTAEPSRLRGVGRDGMSFPGRPKRLRDERDLPKGLQQAGFGITRNPGVAMVWSTRKWKTWRPPGGGILFNIGEPDAIDWFAEGRPATNGEIMKSVTTGIPLLLEQAAEDGAVACFQLGQMTQIFLNLIPSLAPSEITDALRGVAETAA